MNIYVGAEADLPVQWYDGWMCLSGFIIMPLQFYSKAHLNHFTKHLVHFFFATT